MNYQISIARVEIKRNDKSRHSRWFVFPIESLLKMNRSPQGPAGVCQLGGFLLEIIFLLASSRFLLIKNRSSLTTSLVVWTHSTTKRVKGYEKAQTCCENRRLQAFWRYCEADSRAEVCILMMWLHQLKALIQKETFFFFSCLNQWRILPPFYHLKETESLSCHILHTSIRHLHCKQETRTRVARGG